ncbi:MAG: hypothetical protein IAF58_16165 [Leptolyngbya sp.]|nr:hypothetical protein [Candidatus Melainabacteria bacterium]
MTKDNESLAKEDKDKQVVKKSTSDNSKSNIGAVAETGEEGRGTCVDEAGGEKCEGSKDHMRKK